MDVRLIAGYLAGKLDKKFSDRDNSHTGDILIPVKFVDSYSKFWTQGADLEELKRRLEIDEVLIEGHVKYIYSLIFSKEFMETRYIRLTPAVNSTESGTGYLAMNYEIDTYDRPGEPEDKDNVE